jgi:hypothetical protein
MRFSFHQATPVHEIIYYYQNRQRSFMSDITVNNIQRTISDLGMSNNVFCRLAGISPASWDRTINLGRNLTWDEARRLAAVCEDLKAICHELDPVRIDMKNYDCLRMLLNLKNGGVSYTVQAVATGAADGKTRQVIQIDPPEL